jgi:hypothetical protein
MLKHTGDVQSNEVAHWSIFGISPVVVLVVVMTAALLHLS